MATGSATQTARRAVAAYFAAVGAMDVDALEALFAPDGVVFDPVSTLPIEAHAGLQAYLLRLAAAFRSYKEVPERAFFGHEGAAVAWVAEAVSASGEAAPFAGIHVFEIGDDGRVQTLWTYRDRVPFELTE